jgi:endogenous inhibitor of DNA gyrase (YacG/DUF329 family)
MLAMAPVPPRCVYCRKHPVEEKWRPFCSERCKLLDLAAWATGVYRLPGEPIAPSDEAGESSDDNDDD